MKNSNSGYINASYLIMCLIISNLCFHKQAFDSYNISVLIRSLIMNEVSKKISKINNFCIKHNNIGKMTNILSCDMNSI
jgi:hypothetical protein